MTSLRTPTPFEHTQARPPGAAKLALAYWLPAVLFVALIFMVSGRPHLKPPVRFPMVDKLAHLCEYGVLGLLLSRALRSSAPGTAAGRRAAWAIAGGVLVGAGDEWFQSFIPGRESSLMDLAADAAGVTIAQWLPRGLLPE